MSLNVEGAVEAVRVAHEEDVEANELMAIAQSALDEARIVRSDARMRLSEAQRVLLEIIGEQNE